MKNKTNTPAEQTAKDLQEIKAATGNNPRVIIGSVPPATTKQEPAPAEKPSTLKTTPDILTDADRAMIEATKARKALEVKLQRANDLDKLTRGYYNLNATAERLAGFKIPEGDEHTEIAYGSAVITIKDAERKEFSIGNPILINAVLLCLFQKIETRKAEILEKIKNFTLDTI